MVLTATASFVGQFYCQVLRDSPARRAAARGWPETVGLRRTSTMSGAGLARVALKAFSVGVDKVPDKYWHKIPIFKPQEEKDKEKRQRHRQRRKGRSSSESSGSDYQPEEEDYDDHRSVRAHEDDSGPRLNQTQRHSSQEHHARHHGATLPYSINNATSKQKESDDPIPTFTTPSYIPVPMSDYPYDSRPQGEPPYRKYNPADYEPSANDRGQNQRGYYQSNGQPQSTSNAYQPVCRNSLFPDFVITFPPLH